MGSFSHIFEASWTVLWTFLAVSRRAGSGLEASWKRRESILEASWGVYKELFLVLKAILQSWDILNTLSLMYETTLISFFKGI